MSRSLYTLAEEAGLNGSFCLFLFALESSDRRSVDCAIRVAKIFRVSVRRASCSDVTRQNMKLCTWQDNEIEDQMDLVGVREDDVQAFIGKRCLGSRPYQAEPGRVTMVM